MTAGFLPRLIGREERISTAGFIGFRGTGRSPRICAKAYHPSETGRSDIAINIVPDTEQAVAKIYCRARNSRGSRKRPIDGKPDTTAHRGYTYDTPESRNAGKGFEKTQQCGKQGYQDERESRQRRHQ